MDSDEGRHDSSLISWVALAVLRRLCRYAMRSSPRLSWAPRKRYAYEGINDAWLTSLGWKKWAFIQSGDRRDPTCDRSGPCLRFPMSGGRSLCNSSTVWTGPHIRTSGVFGRTYWEWQLMHPSEM